MLPKEKLGALPPEATRAGDRYRASDAKPSRNKTDATPEGLLPSARQFSSFITFTLQSLITRCRPLLFIGFIYPINGVGNYAYSLCSSRRIFAARSPMMDGATVLRLREVAITVRIR